ncbi:MAG: glycosyltransferase family 2 protein [Bacteroidetes bacterium]|nr:glycosyltransferase family 2 protein [Bacteroidota bacterium]
MNLSQQFPSVGVVILNWNGRHFLQQFLPSVMASNYPALKVYVADNGSTDDTLVFLKNNFPGVHLIEMKQNAGFTGGYNEALKYVDDEILVLLNSDIEVDPHWIHPVVDMFSSDNNIAAIQPKILDYKRRDHFEYAGGAGGWIDSLGYPFNRGRIFDEVEKDLNQYDQKEAIFWASGAAMFVRRACFFEVGGFDPYFFAHQEEIDLCWRLQLAGYKIMACPESIVYHVGGGTLQKENPQKTYLNFRNNLIMLFKNNRGLHKWYVIVFRLLLDAISAWKGLLSVNFPFFASIARAHFSFMKWQLIHKKQSIFPQKRVHSPKGIYKGKIVWDYFILGKKRFSEIVKN